VSASPASRCSSSVNDTCRVLRPHSSSLSSRSCSRRSRIWRPGRLHRRADTERTPLSDGSGDSQSLDAEFAHPRRRRVVLALVRRGDQCRRNVRQTARLSNRLESGTVGRWRGQRGCRPRWRIRRRWQYVLGRRSTTPSVARPASRVPSSLSSRRRLSIFTGVFATLPEAILAAVVIVAVTGLMDTGSLRQLYRVSRTEFAIAMAAFLGVLSPGCSGASSSASFCRCWWPFPGPVVRRHTNSGRSSGRTVSSHLTSTRGDHDLGRVRLPRRSRTVLRER